jgi:uncharacterized protein (DUF305 family)/uncharacterized cupredoxin-like copper-binding protein
MNCLFIRRPIRAIALFALVAVFAFTGAIDAATPTPDAHTGHHAEMTPTAMNPCGSQQGEMPMSGGTMSGSPMSGMGMSQDFDLMFIDMMTAQHRSAIVMAQVALSRGEHQKIRDFAANMVMTQQAEIDQMKTWRDAWYPGSPEMTMGQMGQMFESMMQGMPAMTTPAARGMGAMGSTMTMLDPHAGATALCTASGPFDEAFLRMMIPHHQSAVAMAQVALDRATHPEIKQLAQGIVDSQQREIAQMQEWRTAWYGATPTASPAASSAFEEVDVTLSEFSVAASRTDFQAGQTYHFVVTNAGAIPHEFMIVPKMDNMGAMDMAALDAVALAMIPADELTPGATRTVDVTFPAAAAAGELEIVCTLPGHFEAGMVLPITVSA